MSVVLSLATIVSAPPAAAANERVERQEYLLGDLIPDCDIPLLTPPSIPPVPGNKGGACFGLRSRYLSVKVTIKDRTGLPVAASYVFRGRSGAGGQLVPFCQSFTRRVPTGAGVMVIYIHGPLSTALGTCLEQGSPGWGTTGTITARFKLGR